MSSENSKILKKKDFIEIEFTGKIKDGEMFDSNIPENIKKINPSMSEEDPSYLKKIKPFVFSLGEGMFLQGIDDFLIGKEAGKKYYIELTPENAFGNRVSKLVQIMPMRVFKEQNIQPIQGEMFNFDGRVAKILSVSGGRVIVDFNHPLAGKIVQYEINVIRKINDISEKIKSLINFLFRKELKFEINKKDKKIIINAEKEMKQFVELFKDKFKDILGFDLEIEEDKAIKESKEIKK